MSAIKQSFANLAPTEAAFLLFMWLGLLASVAFLPGWAYEGSIIRALLAALCVSIVSMNVIALIFEHRLLAPKDQWAAFLIGDSVALPLVAVGIWLLHSLMPEDSLTQAIWWRLLVLALGIIAGLAFHTMDVGGTMYTESQLHSPTKWWHDLFVYPLFTVMLATFIPLIWEATDKGGRYFAGVALAAAGMTLWVYLGLAHDAKNPRPQAHVEFDWNTMSASRV